MVTEYIKRKQKMGYDSEGKLVYKVLETTIEEGNDELFSFDE